jgi:hypothetical protein
MTFGSDNTGISGMRPPCRLEAPDLVEDAGDNIKSLAAAVVAAIADTDTTSATILLLASKNPSLWWWWCCCEHCDVSCWIVVGRLSGTRETPSVGVDFLHFIRTIVSLLFDFVSDDLGFEGDSISVVCMHSKSLDDFSKRRIFGCLRTSLVPAPTPTPRNVNL